MTYSREIFSKAYNIIDERRNKVNITSQQHTDEIYAKFPEIESVNRQISSCSIAAARAVLSGGDVKEQLNALADKSLQLQSRCKEILTSNGYPEDYMEPHYVCDVCKDTASVESDGKTLYCQCFLQILKECACDEINKLSPLKLSTFDTFKLEYYPKEGSPETTSPYLRMSRIFAYCKDYAKNFNGTGRSILMRGATGLGKTHLSLAIANEVLEKGYYAIYVSAPSILSRLENSHFDYYDNEEEHLIQTLCDCDLLIIDDLGTEFISQYTKSVIYNIFNNRLLKNKPVIINTNMTIRELESTYSQRFVSRIMGECDKLDFLGTDIRAKKKI